MSSILICVISGVFWAFFDIARKISLKFFSPKSILIFFMAAQLCFFLTWSLYSNFNLNFSSYLLPGVSLIIIGLISSILFLKALKNSELSLTIPLLSFTPLFSALFSYFFIDEKLTYFQYFAIFFVIIGTLVLYSSDLKIKSILASCLTLKKSLSARLMIIVSICWSITPILDKISLSYSSINIHGLIQSIGFLFFLVLISLPEIKQFSKLTFIETKIIFFVVLIGIIATVLQLYAILNNYVPIMEAIKRIIGQFGALFFGYFFFNEKISKQKVLGIIFLSLGIFYLI